MKKILCLLASVAICSPLILRAQQTPKFVYCEIVGTAKLMSNKVTITVDFGQKMSIWADNRMKQNGKAVGFNTMIDALNFMGKEGWEFAQAYIVTEGSNQNVYHYLLKKPFDELDEETKKEFIKN